MLFIVVNTPLSQLFLVCAAGTYLQNTIELVGENTVNLQTSDK